MIKKFLISLIVIMGTIVVTGCQGGDAAEEVTSNEGNERQNEFHDSEVGNEDTNEMEVENNNDENNNEENSREDVEITVVESKRGDAPEDQGDLHVRWDLHVEEQEDMFLVSGESNLLPNTRVRAMIKSDDYTFIGYHQYARVEEDGTFYVEVKHPQKYDTVLEIYLEMTTFQDPEILEHYGEFLENVEGPLVYIDHNSAREEIHYIVKSHIYYVPMEGKYVNLQSETPEWNFPEDQGDLEVRISDVKVEKDEERFYISGKSNLIEPALLDVRIDLPDYISFGYQNSVVVNPDGSFETRVPYPSDIREDAEMNILIEFKPNKPGQMAMIKELYGEKGEYLQGDLLEKEISGEIYYAKLMLNIK